jgi:DNA-directed RNA polymerase alpha subunit
MMPESILLNKMRRAMEKDRERTVAAIVKSRREALQNIYDLRYSVLRIFGGIFAVLGIDEPPEDEQPEDVEAESLVSSFELSIRAMTVLEKLGALDLTAAEFQKAFSERDILRISGVGKKTMLEISDMMKKFGYPLKPFDEPRNETTNTETTNTETTNKE